MMDNQSGERTRWYLLLICTGTTALSLMLFIKPLVISIDSIYGFLAYKGTLLTRNFNVIAEVSTTDINQVNKHFVSWWSPGQWMFPGFLSYLSGMRIGMSMIIITILSSITGLRGFYRIYRFYGFSKSTSLLSIIFLCCSATFYYGFVIYQGGEVLSLAIFPWFLLYVVRMKETTIKTLFILAALVIFCFVAKTTLLIYALLLISFQPVSIHIEHYIKNGSFKLFPRSVLVFIPLIVCGLFIYYFFLNKGIKPTVVNELNVSLQDFLVPLSSPVTSILSVQQWITRAAKLVENPGQQHAASLLADLLYFICFLLVTISGIFIYRLKKINRHYLALLLFLYVGLSLFFVFSYLLDTNIDYSTRHFKFVGFLFLPGLVTVLNEKIKPWIITAALILICLFTILDILYIKRKWTGDRYISANFIYRHYDNLDKTDSLDKTSYSKLLEFDRGMAASPLDKAIFYVESNEDVEMDVRHLCITQKPGEPLYAKTYTGKGPAILACISKRTLQRDKDLLRKKFPSYPGFKAIHETATYIFLLSTN